ncbi:hypothetical protein AOLI_G00202550 [Acnodon oligacanthus]
MEIMKEEKEEIDRKVGQMDKGKEKLEEELRQTEDNWKCLKTNLRNLMHGSEEMKHLAKHSPLQCSPQVGNGVSFRRLG